MLSQLELKTEIGKFDFRASAPFHGGSCCDSFLNIQDVEGGVLVRFTHHVNPDGGVILNVEKMAQLIAVLSVRISNMSSV